MSSTSRSSGACVLPATQTRSPPSTPKSSREIAGFLVVAIAGEAIVFHRAGHRDIGRRHAEAPQRIGVAIGLHGEERHRMQHGSGRAH